MTPILSAFRQPITDLFGALPIVFRWQRWISTGVLCLLTAWLAAQSPVNPWRESSAADLPVSFRDAAEQSGPARLLQLDRPLLDNALDDDEPLPLVLPLPDGKVAIFEFQSSPVMEAGLAAKYPRLQSFKGWSSSPGVGPARFSLTAKGFHAAIDTEDGTVYIDPAAGPNGTHYRSYYIGQRALPDDFARFRCETGDGDATDLSVDQPRRGVDFRNEDPLDLRVYQLAMACTGEYAQFHGGTVEQVLSAMLVKVDRINQIFERDLAIRLVLVDNNDKVVFLDAAEDPYNNGDPSAMLAANPRVLNDSLGFINYDIGHVVGTSSSFGGIANLGGVCGIEKGQGASTSRRPEADPFIVSILAHELGHQFDAQHSFNSCHNVNPSTAYEPGGGTTIMSYAGICSDNTNNLQSFTDDYFHVISLEEIYRYTTEGSGRGCATPIPTANRPPSVRIPLQNGFHIPVNTPFELRADADDPDGDALTYSWEQFDLGPELSPPGSPQGDSPLFRSFQPEASPVRVFPKLEKIINGGFDRSEVLPSYARNLTFRCTVRDNHPEAGGVDWAEVSFRSDRTAGPFRVLQPNGGPEQGWEAGAYTSVTWEVANTDNERVNCQLINIRLSVDGGRTYPYTLLENTPNDGQAFVTVPNIMSNQARLRIEAADNIFFDISNTDFEIWPPTEAGYTLELAPVNIPQHCLPAPLTFDIETGAILGYDQALTLDLVGELPPEATYSFSRNPVLPANSEQTQLTIDLGGFVQDTFQLQVSIAAPGQDTAYRELRFATRSNDFSSMRSTAPADGTRGIDLSTLFEWRGAADADNYQFELADNPAFGAALLESATGLTDTSYRPDLLLEGNQVLFWRVRPVNDCGPADWLPVQTFQTSNNICTTYPSEDVPVNISGSGLPTVESTLFISEEALISDLNIPLIRGNYQPVKSLKMTLISPSGTEAVLYDRSCGNTVNFRIGFDDEAPDAITCPPDDGIVFQPLDSLSKFDGESTFGTWTLRVAVVEAGFGASGAIDEWSLEFCADFAPSDPSLLRKDTLRLPPGLASTITNDLLAAEHEDNPPSQTPFMVLELPKHGTLLLDGAPAAVGQRFNQHDIDGFRLRYAHDGSLTERDSFAFIIQNNNGGWLPRTFFPISIEEGAVTDVDEPLPDTLGLRLFPNPFRDRLNISFESDPGGPLLLHLFNLQGQELLRQRFDRPGTAITLTTPNMAEGMYLLRLELDGTALTRRVVIGR